MIRHTLIDPSALRIAQAYTNANLMSAPEAKGFTAFPGLLDSNMKAEAEKPEAPEAAEAPKKKIGRPRKVADPAVVGKKGIDPTKAKVM